jgi:hemerythrin
MKFTWNRDYETNIKIVDEQHQHYFEIVNRIYKQLEKQSINKELILKIVDELLDYASYHFRMEEEYFIKFNYEDAEHHTSLHDFYRQRISEFQSTAIEKDANFQEIMSELTEFATDWFINHIIIEDKKYIECFKKNGLE